MSEWISVEDRLPKARTTILFACDDGSVYAGYRNQYNECFYSDANNGVGCTKKAIQQYGGKLNGVPLVTHWMLLAEPPREKSSKLPDARPATDSQKILKP